MSSFKHRITSILVTVSVIALISACSTAPVAGPSTETEIGSTAPSVQELLNLSRNSTQPRSSAYLISALELMIEDQQITEANEVLGQFAEPANLESSLQTRLALIRADLALADRNIQAALDLLSGPLLSRLDDQANELQSRVYQRRARAYIANNQAPEAVVDLVRFSTFSSPDEKQSAHDLIWQTLETVSGDDLTLMASSADSYETRGWVELARLTRAQQHSIKNQIDAVRRWQSTWTRHGANTLLPSGLRNLETLWQQRPTHIALLLPLQDQVGRAVQEGFLSAYYQALEMDNEAPRISVFDTSGVTEVRGIYETAIESGADLVIGPLNKALVRQLSNLSDLPVPTLALNYTDLQSRNSENFFQFGLAPEDEMVQVANLAWNAGYRNAAIVSPASEDYQQLQQEFTRYWQALGGELVSSVSYSGDTEYATVIKQLLAINASESRAARLVDLLPRNEVEFVPRRRGDIDFIFLMANPRQGRQIKPTLAFYYAGEIPVYALPAIFDGTKNQIANQDLDGIIFTDTPWMLSEDEPLKQQLTNSMRSVQGPLQRLRALGVDAFRLYPRLSQFSRNEISRVRGTTGVLSMTAFGSFRRVPQSAIFVDGLAVSLTNSLNP